MRLTLIADFPGGSAVKNIPASAGEVQSLGQERSPGEEMATQCPCPGNPMDRGAWQITSP